MKNPFRRQGGGKHHFIEGVTGITVNELPSNNEPLIEWCKKLPYSAVQNAEDIRDHLPALLRLAEDIITADPDFVVGLDRSGRPTATAMADFIQPDSWPAIDGRLHFAHVSVPRLKPEPKELRTKIVEPFVDELLGSLETYGKAEGVVYAIDTIAASGKTAQFFQNTVEQVSDGRLEVRFGALVGDTTCPIDYSASSGTYVFWDSNADLCGVSYESKIHAIPTMLGTGHVLRGALQAALAEYSNGSDLDESSPNDTPL